MRYSFAKTPLKAAQAPLATARASQGALLDIFGEVGGGCRGGRYRCAERENCGRWREEEDGLWRF